MKISFFKLLSLSSYFAILFWLLIVMACQKPVGKEKILCTVGEYKITVDEFVQRVETSPEIFITGSATKDDMLNILIDEVILAGEAQKAGLDKSPLIDRLVGVIEDMALSRALYQLKVQEAIQIDSSEIDLAVKMSNETRRVAYLYLPDEKTAHDVQQRLAAGESFEAMVREFYKMVPDSQIMIKEIQWGEQPEPLENAIFALQPGEVSPVLQLPSGLLIIKLEDIITQPLVTQSELIQRRVTARKKITARKQARQSNHYVHEFMTGQEVKFDEKLAQSVIERLARKIIAAPNAQALAQNSSVLTDSLFVHTENSFTPWLDETLVTFRNGELTLRQLLDKWRQSRLPVNTGSIVACQKSIAHNFSILVRDVLLVREARRLGYAKLQQVQDDCRIWRNHYSSELLTRELQNKGITVASFIRDKKQDYNIIIDKKMLDEIVLTDIPLLAVRPGQYHSRVSPPWPDY